MHELTLARGIVDLAVAQARQAACARVRVVRLEFGAFGCVEEGALRFCFDAAARGTLAEGAAIDIIHAPGEAWCLDCHDSVRLDSRLAPCPRCGGERLQVTGGQDLRVRELEVE